MAGRGPAPKANRLNPREPLARGDVEILDAVGWQHGPVPEPPDGLVQASRDAWVTWMGSWFAAHWTADDLPALEVVITLYDQVRRGEYQRANELRLQMDTYGITPKGQQDRRWRRPSGEKPTAQLHQIKPRKLSGA